MELVWVRFTLRRAICSAPFLNPTHWCSYRSVGDEKNPEQSQSYLQLIIYLVTNVVHTAMAEETTPTATASPPAPEPEPAPQAQVSQNTETLPTPAASDPVEAKSAVSLAVSYSTRLDIYFSFAFAFQHEPAEQAEPNDAPDPNPGETTKPEAEVEEPQNSLTRKFTDEEWKALKELRVRLLISIPKWSIVKSWFTLDVHPWPWVW